MWNETLDWNGTGLNRTELKLILTSFEFCLVLQGQATLLDLLSKTKQFSFCLLSSLQNSIKKLLSHLLRVSVHAPTWGWCNCVTKIATEILSIMFHEESLVHFGWDYPIHTLIWTMMNERMGFGVSNHRRGSSPIIVDSSSDEQQQSLFGHF